MTQCRGTVSLPPEIAGAISSGIAESTPAEATRASAGSTASYEVVGSSPSGTSGTSTESHRQGLTD